MRILPLLVSLFICLSVQAQKKKAPSYTSFDEKYYNAIQWRSIGPYRGGRSCAVTGVSGKPNLYYFGSTGGGVWRTTNGGSSWENITDGYFGGSIGAVAVSEWDPNVIYAGGGEKTIRGNVSSGYGVWKSTDAGKSWESCGLKKSRHISRIRIHPRNPDLIYAAVMGNAFASSEERGVYRSKDGGLNWEKVLYANEDAGAVDLLMDPTNPRILYASTWNFRRTPFSFSSGGAGSALWKSTDGGDSWKEISGNKGFAKGTLGIIGIAVSPAKPDRIWAMVEAAEGGVFRSEDGGKNWKRVNTDRSLRQRAWYYSRIYADPQNEDVVYVVNVAYHKSKDGGKTFSSHYAPHGDHHDLWIAPEDPARMIIGDDGGAQITFDGGESWSTYYNQPTAQFYRVTTDNSFPYRIYAAQQDNSTIRIPHRTSDGDISRNHWEATAGGESAHIAPDPLNSEIVYGGSYDGYLTRKDHQNDQMRAINVWPDNPMGYGAEEMKYRFNWNFPLFFSSHDPKKLYTFSNHVHVSTDEGQSWQTISPDLTHNDSAKLGSSGGPITKDNTSVEYYCTIFAAAESPVKEGLIWVGSDDGLVHLTRDGGISWENVSPAAMPEWMMINSIAIDPFNEGGAYIAGTRYKMGDFKPYIYKTENYGQSWKKLTNGIENEHFTRVVRADPNRKGLLYAGTESGMYLSFDDGLSWQSFQLNLPIVPITDLTIKDNNLIAATQGRSLWIIDDLSPLHQLDKEFSPEKFYLYKPKPAYRMRGWARQKPQNAGINHPAGVMVYYYIPEGLPDSMEVKLSFFNGKELIREFSNKAKEKTDSLALADSCNLFIWDMRYPKAEDFESMVMWWASTNGPKILPGQYRLRLSIGDEFKEQTFEILRDPRSVSSSDDLKMQFDYLMEVRNKLSETHNSIIKIQSIREQLDQLRKKLAEKDDFKAIVTQADKIDNSITVIEKALYQTRNKSNQDPLNFPIKLNNKLAHLNSLMEIDDFRPTQQAIKVKNELVTEINEQLTLLNKIMAKDIPDFNQLVRESMLDAIMVE